MNFYEILLTQKMFTEGTIAQNIVKLIFSWLHSESKKKILKQMRIFNSNVT